MVEQVLERIDELVVELHTPDQDKVNEKYLNFIDALGTFLEEMQKLGYSVDLTQDLQEVGQAMTKKDYILLSDILLYTVRKDFENLGKELEKTEN